MAEPIGADLSKINNLIFSNSMILVDWLIGLRVDLLFCFAGETGDLLVVLGLGGRSGFKMIQDGSRGLRIMMRIVGDGR